MADTYSSSNRLAIQTVGGNDSTWGDILNTSMGLIDTAADGQLSKAVAGSNITLTTANNASDEARNRMYIFTGTPGALRTITLPDVKKICFVYNNTDAVLTFTAGAGTTVALAVGARAVLYTDGATNVAAHSHISAYARTLLDDADAAAVRATLGLGSMSTQAASAVAITGGTISGISLGTLASTTFDTCTFQGGTVLDGGLLGNDVNTFFATHGGSSSVAGGANLDLFTMPSNRSALFLVTIQTAGGSGQATALIHCGSGVSPDTIIASWTSGSAPPLISLSGTSGSIVRANNQAVTQNLIWSAIRISQT